MKNKIDDLKRLLPEQIKDLESGKEVCLEGVYFIPKDFRLRKPPKIVKK